VEATGLEIEPRDDPEEAKDEAREAAAVLQKEQSHLDFED
jgi:hypothetical protein